MNHPVVCCRIRPQPPDTDSSISFFSNESGTSRINVSGNENFELDHVFDCKTTQAQVFIATVPSLIGDLMKGINCTLFTYGQTGSGKTYTMQGPGPALSKLQNSGISDESQGIIPRTVDAIFAEIIRCQDKGKFEVVYSMLEIYQEKLNDLLIPPSPSKAASSSSLKIRELSDGTIWIQGLTEVNISSLQEFTSFLQQGLKRRVTGSHGMNSESSRSHLCCSLTIKQQKNIGGKISSKLHLIDLAGSELVRKTEVVGARLQEAKHINKSLSALGNVINALSNRTTTSIAAGVASTSSGLSTSPSLQLATQSTNASQSTSIPLSKQHIPYRDSKLTRVLQDSLGGNSRIVLVLAVSAAPEHINETVATLRFGERARTLTMKPRINTQLEEKDYKSALIAANSKILSLSETINELQAQVRHLKRSALEHATSAPPPNPTAPTIQSKLDIAMCSMCAAPIRESPSVPLNDDVGGKDSSKTLKLPPISAIAASINKQKQAAAAAEQITADSLKKSSKTLKVPEQKKIKELPRKVASPVPIGMPIKVSKSIPDLEEDVKDLELDGDSKDEYNRCAVCNLDDIESDRLRRDTGECLGSMFLCDGNCGQRFHVRCVGLVGEAGQFVLPEGEWMCSMCTVDVSETPGSEVNSVSGSPLTLPPQQPSSDVSKGTDRVSSLKTDVDRDGDSLLELFSNTDHKSSWESKVASIKAEYHLMRRERNRVLGQWQHEKKIARLIAEKRDADDIEKDREMLRLADEVDRLQAQLRTATSASILSTGSHSISAVSPFSISPTKPSITHSKSFSVVLSAETVENSTSKREKKVDSSDKTTLSPRLAATTTSSPHKGSTPVILLSRSLENPLAGFDPLRAAVTGAANSMRNSVSTDFYSSLKGSSSTKDGSIIEEGDTAGSSIPKPWRKKASAQSTPSNSDSSSRHSSLSTTKLASPRLDLSAKKVVAAINQDSLGERHPTHDDVASANITSSKSSVGAEAVAMVSSKGQDEGGEEDTFLAPIQSRLKELLQAVQDETGSYAEIRTRHREREDVRHQLRSRGGLGAGAARAGTSADGGTQVDSSEWKKLFKSTHFNEAQ